MLKFNQYLIASLFLACFIVSCGGGGGGSTPNGQNNIPTESTPTDNPPIESNPVESSPESGNNLPEKTISVATSNLSQNNSVYAGQSFTITVTSNNGAAATIKFANASGTPNSVGYFPQSCTVSVNNPCITTVKIGLSTPASSESALYTTNIILTDGNVQNTNSNVGFKVVEPKLMVTSQPQNIVIGYTTTVGFDIDKASIPDGVGIVTLHLQPTSGFIDLVKLDKYSCVITYQDKNTVNGCSDIQITSFGPLSGNTAIYAEAQYFAGVGSDEITVEPGNKPSINITSSLPSGSPAGIVAGHSFKLIATSINGGSGTVYFSATDPGIKLSHSSCRVESESYCEVAATVTLGTPPNLHDIIVDYQSGVAKLPLTRYRFKSETPRLVIVNESNIYSIRKNSRIAMGISLQSASIPEGSGVIMVDLNYSPEGVITGQQSCDIEYANNKIINNKCQDLSLLGTNNGVSKITASAYGFTGEVLPSIVVASKFVYVLSFAQIIMLGELDDGQLVLVENNETNPNIPIIPTEGNPVQIIISSDGRFLYVVDQANNQVIPYAINADTGLPVMQSNLKASTGNFPNKIVFSLSGNFAYVTNYASHNISQYLVNKTTGALIPNNPATVLTELSPAGLVLDQSSKYAYVNNQGSKNISKYTVDSTTGRLGSRANFMVRNDLGNPSNLVTNPTGGNLFYTNDVNVVVQYKLAKNGSLTEPSSFIWYRDHILTGLYFNPSILPNGTNLAYYTTNKGVILSKISANGAWDSMGTISWADEEQNGPNTMAFNRSGRYAYIGHQNSKSISMYKISMDSDGGMVYTGTVNIAVIPLGIVVSPN